MAKKRVLFVDDSKMDRIILSKILEGLDVDYVETSTPEEFLKEVINFLPELCLVDLNISQSKDGYILVKAIRNILGEDLPIIIVSAIEDSEEISKNIKIGANDFVCKPIDKALLSSKVSNYLFSEKIQSQVLPLFRVPKSENSKSEIDFKCEIETITQDGAQFKSPYHIKENTIIRVSDRYFQEIFRGELTTELKVKSCWINEAQGTYHFCAEFFSMTPKKNQAIRKFITTYQNTNS